MRILLMCVLVMPVALGCALGGQGSVHPASTGAPLVLLSGDDSHVRTAGFDLIDSSQQWKAVWLSHLGLEEETIYRPVAQVDFARCMVVVVFGGSSWNSCGYRVDSVTDEAGAKVVRYESIAFQTAGPDGGGQKVTPYAFIILPKSTKPVVLEQNVQPYIGHPPQWRQVARLSTVEQ